MSYRIYYIEPRTQIMQLANTSIICAGSGGGFGDPTTEDDHLEAPARKLYL